MESELVKIKDEIDENIQEILTFAHDRIATTQVSVFLILGEKL